MVIISGQDFGNLRGGVELHYLPPLLTLNALLLFLEVTFVDQKRARYTNCEKYHDDTEYDEKSSPV